MAIARDNHKDGLFTSGPTHTFSYTCSGANLILFVLAGLYAPSGDTLTGITYHGVSMTLAAKEIASSTYLYIYYLINPDTGGAWDVVISNSVSGSISGNAVSYTGAKQSAQPDKTQPAHPGVVTTQTTSLTTVADNSWEIMGVASPSGGYAAGANSTLLDNNSGGIMALYENSNGALTPAGSFGMTSTMTSADVGVVLVSFAPAVGGGGPVVQPRLMMLGYGN